MSSKEAFFTLHADLPREGPGCADDVTWAVAAAQSTGAKRVMDAGCGPGADIPALLAAMPDCQITAVDTHAAFIERVVTDHAGPRVDAFQADMLEQEGPFDFIWSAGAIYFHGLANSLSTWHGVLTQGGHVAFSYPAYFTDAPSDGAVAFWSGFDGVLTLDALEGVITEAGYTLKAHRPVSDAAWEAYYTPMEARIASLSATDDPDLRAVLDEGREEVSGWRAHRQETGYILAVVAPR